MSKFVRLAAAVAGVAVIAVAGYLAWQQQNTPRAETAHRVNFQPAPDVLAERVKFQMTQEMGTSALGTTQPVSASMQAIPFGQTYVNEPLKPNPYISPTDTDADSAGQTVPVPGAYLVRFSNGDLCNEQGACPVVLATKAEGNALVRNTLLKVDARNVWVSTRASHGNPDLIVDHGVPGLPPVRMVWSTEGQYPTYEPVFDTPLPELK